MKPYYSENGITIYHGDCRKVMLGLSLVDAIVTDPPYGLGFMGKGWDHGVPGAEFWEIALGCAKPGAHLLAFGGTRTFHRLACAIEDAGWGIRDTIMWVYGSGFPKSVNLGDGRGTALKPAWEPIILARKPVDGTLAQNLPQWGTGALNIDACRINPGERVPGGGNGRATIPNGFGSGLTKDTNTRPRVAPHDQGRWPANLIHDGSEEVLSTFPDAPGQQGDLNGQSKDRKSLGIFGDMPAAREATARLDSGSAARFFYCAKATQEDRNEGCKEIAPRAADTSHKRPRAELDDPRRAGVTPRPNHHPTVKPTALMRYLVRLITPPGGVVLDPFAGSGSTGKACALENLSAILVDTDSDYCEIAARRSRLAQPSFLHT